MSRRVQVLIVSLCIFSLSTVLHAQKREISGAHEKAYSTPIKPIVSARSVSDTKIDTLGWDRFFGCPIDSLYLWPSVGGGWLNGTNWYGDLEKAQSYSLAGGGTLGEVLVLFGAKEQAETPGTVACHVYSTNSPTSAPGVRLGTSTLSMTEVDTAGFVTLFQFEPPVTVGDHFFISVEMSTTPGDTVAIFANDTCYVDAFTWERWDDNTWHTIASAWGLVLDFGIFPLVETEVVSVQTKSSEGPLNFTLAQNYPNPFNPSTTIDYLLAERAAVALKIYNLAGQEIRTLVDEVQSAGRQSIQWDGTDARGLRAASGVYLYKLSSSRLSKARKLVLLK